MARTSSNDLNKTRYTRRDYESIKSDLINAIPSLTQEWTSREEADPGIVLIKLMAMFGDTLSYNVDKIALELYISTVTQRKNCAKILKLLGYKMHWYRSARVMAHIRLIVNQDAEGNIGHVILKPYQTQFVAGNIRYTVVSQSIGSGDIDIYSDTISTEVKLIEGNPVTVSFDKSVLVNNRYYFGNYNLDESEIILNIDGVTNSKVTCQLVDNLYLVSSNTIIYYEFGIDDYDRPYIELCEGWEDIAGTDTASFSVTYILSSGSLGNVSDNAFSNIYNYEAENVSPSNLVINNLSNLTNYGTNEDGEYLESYNSPGYDPQSVPDARIDSAKYVFTHDTLVTSSDYEKACKRANQDITVSKLVDGQVIINDMLDIDDICTRALDRFTKTYVVEDSLSNPGEKEVNQYLLAYQVILYLAYQNFTPRFNYYFNPLDTDSIWCLRREEDGVTDVDPYGREYWERTEEFTVIDQGDYTFELSGPKNSLGRNQTINVEVIVNEIQVDPKDFIYDGNGTITLLMEEKPSTIDSKFMVNVETVPQTITHFDYTPEQGTIIITDNIPSVINSLVLNTSNWYPNRCSYNRDSDTVTIEDTADIPVGSTVKIKKIYSANQYYIQLEQDYPEAVTSLFINGEQVSNYDYDKETGKIILNSHTNETAESIIINGKVLDTEIQSESVKLQSPGYYPYKPTTNIILSVIELLNTLKILNVDLDFGTMKLFPFKVEGIVHLVETVAPAEALQIIEIIDEALVQAYYPDLHPIGEKPDFIEIVDIIQNSDPRIKYFDAINNIVEWAPEVQKRLKDMDNIFDTTSAIMYNGLSNNFNLSKRFMRFKFKNTAVLPDSLEEDAIVTYGSEGDILNIPYDYGTAYLAQYSVVAKLDHIVRVLPNTYLTLQVNTLEELRALNYDLNFRGFTDIRYVRTPGNSYFKQMVDSVSSGIPSFEDFNGSDKLYVIDAISNENINYLLTDVPSNVPTDNIKIAVKNNDNILDDIEYTVSRTNSEDIPTLSIDQLIIIPTNADSSIRDGNYVWTGINPDESKILKVVKVNNQVETVLNTNEYRAITSGNKYGIEIYGGYTSDDVIKVYYYLPLDSVIEVYHAYHQYQVEVDSDELITKITWDEDNINDLYCIDVDGSLYYEFEQNVCEISEEYNENLLETFNNITLNSRNQNPVVYKFKFNHITNEPTEFAITRFVDQIDNGQEVTSPSYYVFKNTLINNTGMQWVKED